MRRTRRFARHQLTWFRRWRHVEWIDVGPEEPLDSIGEKVLKKFNHSGGSK